MYSSKGVSRRMFLRRAGATGICVLGCGPLTHLPWDTAEAARVATLSDYADLAAQ